MTPLMAPEAPTMGMGEAGLVMTWARAAVSPQTR